MYKQIAEMEKTAKRLREQTEKAVSSSQDFFGMEALNQLDKAVDFTEALSKNLGIAKDLNFKEGARDLEALSKSASALSANLSKNLIEFNKQYEKIQKVQDEITALERKTGRSADESKKLDTLRGTLASLKQEGDTLRDAVELARASLSENYKLNEKIFENTKLQIKAIKKEAEFLSENIRGTFLDPEAQFIGGDFDKKMERIEGLASDVSDSFSSLFSADFGSFSQKATSLLKALGTRSRALSEKVRMDQANKGKGQSLGGSALGGAGKFLMGGAAIGGGLLAAVSAIQSVEEKMKGVNKELIQTYGATDLMTDSSQDFGQQIMNVNKELSDPDFANTLGVTLEESRQLVGNLQQVGLNIRTMKGDMSGLKDLTVGFQAASKMLGIEFSDVAGVAQNFREELGVAVSEGHLLNRMAKEFGKIRDMAAQSSFSTNRFFQTIQSLTDGIGSMNVRIGEAGKLFISLSKVLGPKAAQEFASGLLGGFKSEGVVDRYKRLLLTGKGKMQSTFKRSSKATDKDFMDNLTEAQKNIIDKAGGLGAIKTEADLKRVMGELRRGTEGGTGVANQLMRAFNLRKAARGNESDMVKAMGDLDLSGTMSAQMQQIYAFLGQKGFEGISAVQLEALANYTGKSIEELQQLKMLDFAYQDDFKKSQEILAAGKGKTDEQLMADLKAAGIENIKVKGGKLVSESGDLISSIEDYIQAQGAEIDATGAYQIDQLSLLAEVKNATLTSADMINNHLGALLTKIYGPVDFLTGWLTKDDADAKKAREERRLVSEQIGAETEQRRTSLMEKEQKLRDFADTEKKRISGIKDPKERAKEVTKSNLEIEKQKSDIEKEKAQLRLLEKQQETLNSSEGMDLSGPNIKEYSAEMAKSSLSRTKSGRKSLDILSGEGSGALAAVARVLGLGEGSSGQGVMSQIFDKGITEEQKSQLKAMGLDVDLAKLASETKFTPQGTTSSGIDVTKDLTRLNISEAGGAPVISQLGTKTTSWDASTYGRGGIARKESTMKSDSAVFSDLNLEEDIKRSEEQQLRLNEIAKILEDQTITDADRRKYTDEKANIEAEVLAKNKKYQEATGKTFSDAILSAEKQKLNTQIGNLLGEGVTLGEDRYNNRAIIERLRATPNSEALIAELPKYFATDMKFDPYDDRPILLRKGTATIGTSTDSAYFRDNTAGGSPVGGVGSMNIHITINGGDENKVFRTVQDAIRRNREAT